MLRPATCSSSRRSPAPSPGSTRRTLQFRPAEPWPPLAAVVVKVEGKSFRLATLMAAPTASQPANGAEGLPPLEAISLTFPEPISPEALARAVTIEHRPLPGLASDDVRRLSRQDFDIKSVERASPGDAAGYVLRLRQPIPLGRKVFVRFALRLTDGAGATDASAPAVSELSFATAEPFRAVRFGCRAHRASGRRERGAISRRAGPRLRGERSGDRRRVQRATRGARRIRCDCRPELRPRDAGGGQLRLHSQRQAPRGAR